MFKYNSSNRIAYRGKRSTNRNKVLSRRGKVGVAIPRAMLARYTPGVRSGAAELKFWDADCAGTLAGTITLPTTSQSLNLIPQGDTESTRDGRYAFIKSIQIRGDVILNPSTGATVSGPFFMWLILDTQANGAVALNTDVFTNVSTPSQSMLNLNNSGRFKILKYWNYVLEPAAGVSAAYNHATKHIEYYSKCNIKIDWSSTTGAITEIRSNNLFLMIGSENIGTDVTYDLAVRLRFQG